jgi:hypothetical protein
MTTAQATSKGGQLDQVTGHRQTSGRSSPKIVEDRFIRDSARLPNSVRFGRAARLMISKFPAAENPQRLPGNYMQDLVEPNSC